MLETPFRDRVVIPKAKALGWKVYFTYRSDNSPAGFPDLVLCRERVIYAELKSDEGELSAKQHEWLAALSAAGQECHVWYPKDINEITAILTRRQP